MKPAMVAPKVRICDAVAAGANGASEKCLPPTHVAMMNTRTTGNQIIRSNLGKGSQEMAKRYPK